MTNQASAVDGGNPRLLAIEPSRPATTDSHRWAT